MPISLPVYLLLFSVFFTGQAWGDLNTVKDLREAYSKHLMSRNQYLDRLATLRFKIIDLQEKPTNGEEAEGGAIDDEIRRNYMTSTGDSKLLPRLRVGEWESPRHDYLYRADGSWTMLPIIPNVTCGRWKIEGHTYYDWVPIYAPKDSPYKIILLDEHYFIFSNGSNQLFYEKRLK
jgi:hypothetical protein